MQLLCVWWSLVCNRHCSAPLEVVKEGWPKPPKPSVTGFTASACWDKQNIMGGWRKSKKRFFWSLFCSVIFGKGGLRKWLFLLHLQGLIYQLYSSSTAFLAHFDRHILFDDPGSVSWVSWSPVCNMGLTHLWPCSQFSVTENCSQVGN